jgi:hypothetical protein
MADAIAELGGDTDGDTVPGLAHEELAQLSHHVDLLVVGSRSYGPLRRLLLGSTSAKLVHEAACPVLVLPRGQAAQPGTVDGSFCRLERRRRVSRAPHPWLSRTACAPVYGWRGRARARR